MNNLAVAFYEVKILQFSISSNENLDIFMKWKIQSFSISWNENLAFYEVKSLSFSYVINWKFCILLSENCNLSL